MIKIENISKAYKLYKHPIDRIKEIILRKKYHILHKALDKVSFTVNKGEVLGIIGPNGAGKSTLLKILTGVTIPDEGIIKRVGRITGLLELGTGFNYELSGRENIYLNGLLIGMSKKEISEKEKSIIEFSELEEFIDEPLKTYSSGMIMRLAFSIAIHSEPECFVIDEALSVGDAYFQQKCFNYLKKFKEKGGSIIFVSHDLNAIKTLCDRAIFLAGGKIIYEGSPEEVVNKYNEFIVKKIEKANVKTKKSKRGFSYGTFDVEIIDVKISGEFSKNNILTSGENARIEIKLIVKENLKNPTVGILIRDKYGIDIFGINTDFLGIKLNLEKDTLYTVSLNVQINLHPGKYSITAAVHSGDKHTESCYHWIDNITTFEVTGFLRNRFSGIVNLPVKDFRIYSHR